ncbi:MAG: hypothetical protein CML04_01960 [Pseudozobellia sp.]|nr:hypothetical protein [Pseudozobellia sp.]MBG48947.1 hypothetical protein [Pseudozobellia sp.]|tara:strand:- start:489 stop:1235 length:747 start_codon:yes stop_codon:yes gene_type:complete
MCLSCKDAKPQTIAEIRDAKTQMNKENTRQFILGAIKLCKGTDYTQLIGTTRKTMTSEVKNTPCSNYIGYPYINPFELYVGVMDDDRTLNMAMSNPIEMKQAREKIALKADDIKDEADHVDPNNLIYHDDEAWSVRDYDIDQEQLTVGAGLGYERLSLLQIYNGGGKTVTPIRTTYNIPVSKGDAEALFESFNSQALKGKKPVHVKVTYALKQPERLKGYQDKFEIHFKKIEFYQIDDLDNKLGEVTF